MIANIITTILSVAAVCMGWKAAWLGAVIGWNVIIIAIAIVDYNNTLADLKLRYDKSQLTSKQYAYEKNIANFCFYATLVSCGLSVLLTGLGLYVLTGALARAGIEVLAAATGLLGWTIGLTAVDIVTSLSYKSRLQGYRRAFNSVIR
jgi:hypothetical protein